MSRFPLLCLLSVVPTLTWVQTPQTYALVYKPKLGQEMKFKLTMEVKNGEQQAVATANFVMKIVKVDESGNFRIEGTMSDAKAVMNGQEAPEKSTVYVTSFKKYDTTGKAIEESTAPTSQEGGVYFEPFFYRFPEKPVAIGGKWNAGRDPDSKSGFAGSRTTFSLTGLDKLKGIEVLVVHFNTRTLDAADSGAAQGDFYVATDDFRVVRFELTNEVKNPTDGSVSGSMKVKAVPM